MTVEQAIYNILHAVYGEEVRDSLAEGLRAMNNKSEADKLASEAWATGTKNSVDVPPSDPAYHNNSKYYSEQSRSNAQHSPRIGLDGNWYLWNGTAYVDSGVSSHGVQGPQGIQGPAGPQGISGVAVAVEGQYGFSVNDQGHLIIAYTDDSAPNFSIDSNGHLIYTV